MVVPGNHDSRNVGYVHFEELIGERKSVVRKAGVTVVAVDSTEPDLDHGHIGRGSYSWIEQQFAEPSELRVFVLHHHLLPIPGTGRERNVVYDAGDAIECLQRAGVQLVLSGHKHVPYAWKLEDLFVVNTGTVVDAAPERKHTTLLQRRPGGGLARRGLAPLSLPRPGADHPVRPAHRRVREVHGPDRARGECKAVSGVRAVALVDGEHYPDVVREALNALPYEWVGAILVGGTEKLRGQARVRRAARDGLRGSRARRRPVRRAGARARRAVPLGLARTRRRVSRMSGRTSLRSTAAGAVRAAVRLGDRHRQARREDGGDGALRRLLARRPFGGRRRDGSRRTAGAGVRHRCRRPLPSSSPGRGPGAMPRRTISRRRRPAACRRSAVAARAAAWPELSSRRTSRPERGSPPTASPDVVIFDGSGAAIPPVATDRRILVVGPAAGCGRVPEHLSSADLRPRDRGQLRGRRRVAASRYGCGRWSRMSGRVAVFTAGGD